MVGVPQPNYMTEELYGAFGVHNMIQCIYDHSSHLDLDPLEKRPDEISKAKRKTNNII